MFEGTVQEVEAWDELVIQWEVAKNEAANAQAYMDEAIRAYLMGVASAPPGNPRESWTTSGALRLSAGGNGRLPA